MSEDRESENVSEDLVRTGGGDRAAFRRIYFSVARKLFAICLRITRDRSAAEDVLQEIFIKVWRSAPSFDPARARASSWLTTIARNSAIDWYRSQVSRPAGQNDTFIMLQAEDEPADDRMIREQREETAMMIVGELNAEEERDLKTIYFQGLTYEQAAEQSGVPLGTVKSRVRRAVAKMRVRMVKD